MSGQGTNNNYSIIIYFSLFVLFQLIESVEISVEENGSNEESTRHLNHLRHTRDGKTSPPYMAATSSLTKYDSDEYESFSLNCPHVTDASNENVKIEVTWTLDDTIWLKIENGEKRIHNRLTSFNKRTISGKTVLRTSLNKGRYWFDYDELTGDFAMEIRPINVEEDAGVWQCHVTVHQKGNTHTLTSRSRVKTPRQHRPHHPVAHSSRIHNSVYRPIINTPMETPTPQPLKIKVFNRPDSESVQISRDDTKKQQTIVFARQNGPLKEDKEDNYAHAAIDYEMSMAEEPLYTSRSGSRVRSAFYTNMTNSRMIITLTCLVLILLYI